MPSWLRRLVEALCPPDRRDEVVGDLEEVHRRRTQRRGRLLALPGTAGDVLGTLAHLLRLRVSEWVRRAAFTGTEFRLALRLLRRSPIVSLTVVLALTCGVTLATAGFTVVQAVFDMDLPFPEGPRVVELELRDARTAERRDPPAILLDALESGVASLEHWGAAAVRTGNLRLGPGEVSLVDVVALTPGGFDYALPPLLAGRGLPTARTEPGEPRPVLLSESLWRSRFGADEDVVGRQVEVSGDFWRVTGVLPDRAGFPVSAELWTVHRPLVDGTTDLALYGVLAPGVSPTAAAAELGALVTGATRAAAVPDLLLSLRSAEDPPGSGSQGLLVVGFLVAFLLVIAGNVGNLMVARASARTEELTIRAALGAHRSRLVTQLALESATLVIVAVAAGLWMADRLLAWFRVSDAEQLPPWIDLSPGPWTVAFVVAVAGLLTLVSGVLPALRATRGTAPSLQSGSRGTTSRAFGWANSSMIVAQIAFSTGILGGAVLVHRAWVGAFDMDQLPGAEAIATAYVTWAEAPPTELLAAVRAAHPGSQVGLSTYLPGVDAPLGPVEVEGRDEPIRVPFARVSPGFWQVVNVPALAGRLTVADDVGGAAGPAASSGSDAGGALPVAVVDRPFVERHLGGTNAVGRRIRLARAGGDGSGWHRIVAVVPDLGLGGMDAESAGGVYLPYTGGPVARLLIRTSNDPVALGRTLPGLAYGVDPGIAVSRIHTLGAVVQGVRQIFRGLGAVFTGLGVLVLVLALMGVYAILSFEVARRRREIGIRVALGASPRDVIRPLLVRVGAYVALGGGLGWLLGAGVVSVARATIRLRLAPGGGEVFAGLALLVLLTASAAALTPALRALRIQPGEALQSE